MPAKESIQVGTKVGRLRVNGTEDKRVSPSHLERLFLEKANAKYGHILDFKKVEYVDATTDITVTCAKHGDFRVCPRWLLFRCVACAQCETEKVTESLEKQFLGMTNGTKKITGFAGFKIRPGSQSGSRIWRSECQKCGRVTTAAIDEFKNPSRCKTCKGRSNGKTGVLVRFNEYKRSAQSRGLEFHLSEDEFEDTTKQPCHYCGLKPLPVKEVYLEWSRCELSGIDRVNNDVGYISGNCVPCCKTCNSAKLDASYIDFVAYLDRLVAYRGVKSNGSPHLFS